MAFLIGILLIFVLHWDITVALLTGVCCGYGILMVWYFALLYRYFPEGTGSTFSFLRWFDRFPQLALVGFFVTTACLAIWSSCGQAPWACRCGVCITARRPMIFPRWWRFFSILITTINFTTSVETRFYPQYKTYFSLFNDGGALEDIESLRAI